MPVRAKNAHRKVHDIHRGHWVALGARHGVVTPEGQPAEAVVDDLVARTPEVVAAVQQQLLRDFPAQVADSILGGLMSAARELAA